MTALWRDELIASAALFLLIAIIRGVAARTIQRSALPMEHRRRWLVQIRTGAVLIVVFGLTLIWAEELRTFALSLMAVAVAVTIAVKELLLCLSGALLRTSARSFTIGDRIQVSTFRGDVIDIGALFTKLLELDELTNRRTGRSISVPNSLFLDKPVLNETFGGKYVLSLLTVPCERSKWREREKRLVDAANATCASFLEEARKQFVNLSKKEGLDSPIVEPNVNVVVKGKSEIELILRFPTPARQTSSVSQEILRRFLDDDQTALDSHRASVEQSLEQ